MVKVISNLFTKKEKNYQFLVFFLLIITLISQKVLAATSANFQIPHYDLGPSREIESTSTSFKLESFIGDLLRGESISPGYGIEHGFFYPEETIFLNLKALPEMRVPATGNFDAHLTVEVRNPGQVIPLFSQIVDTDNNGKYSNLALTGISPGAYDLTAKGYSHLRDKEANIVLTAGSNSVDFSNGETDYLLAGDVNGTNGDNLVNSIDIAIEVLKLDQGLGVEREDLNQDNIVNSIDLAITIKNLDVWGEP